MRLSIYDIVKEIGFDKNSKFPDFIRLSWYILDRHVFNLSGKFFMTVEYKNANLINEKSFVEVETVYLTKQQQ